MLPNKIETASMRVMNTITMRRRMSTMRAMRMRRMSLTVELRGYSSDDCVGRRRSLTSQRCSTGSSEGMSSIKLLVWRVTQAHPLITLIISRVAQM